jgi:hypothetical protein
VEKIRTVHAAHAGTYRATPLAEPHGEHGAEFAETRGSLSRPSTSEKHGIMLRFQIKGLIG